MKKLSIVVLVLLAAAAVLWLSGCSKEENTATSPSADQMFGKGGTRTLVTGTTLGSQGVSITCINSYKWSFSMSMDPGQNSICNQDCKDLLVTVTATKGILLPGFNTHICIQNTGDAATENLAIMLTVLKSCGGGPFEVVRDSIPVDVSKQPILGAGASFCYIWDVNLYWFGGIDPACNYKIVANVTITNYVDHMGVPYGISPESPVIPGCAPASQCVIVTDVPGLITASDPNVSTAGWNLSVLPATLQFCESGTAQFTLHVCNNNVPSEETFTGTNTIVVDGEVVGTATYYLNTLGCTPPGGCSRTIGFYKTHAVAGLYGNNPDMVSSFLPIYLGTQGGAKTLAVTVNTQVVSIMKFTGPGGATNGILKLYAQLLAAKLNIAGANGSGTGTPGSCVAAAISAADAFLATHNANDWAGLTKTVQKQVLGWMSTFDQYNNGYLCAVHCDTNSN